MGATTGTSTSTLENMGNLDADINGGSVILGAGTTNHRTTLNATGFNFFFWATSSLNFGINPGAGDNDHLMTKKTTIQAGASAVLDTSNLGGVAVPARAWNFLTGFLGMNNTIIGAFTPNVGGMAGYTMTKDLIGRFYRLNT